MNNLLSRVLLVAVAIPALYAIVVFLPHLGHGAIVLVAVIFSAGCGAELASMASRKGMKSNGFLFSILAALPSSMLWTVFRIFPGSPEKALLLYIAGLCVLFSAVMAPLVFPRKPQDMADSFGAALASAFPLLYPGLLSSAFVLIADYPKHATQAILWFALLVFGNDSAAWAFGMILGKHRGIVAVSPNKSLEGFVGAFVGSLGASFLGPVLFPGAIADRPAALFVLGLVVGVSVILGDLFESVLKRSAGVKDSGATIPGRGGFLDCFDSILFAAPVFYVLVRLLDLVK